MVINVMNNKGGTGKTTTCVNLAHALAGMDKKVLLIDLDPQASATLSLGVTREQLSPSVADMLFSDFIFSDVVRPSGRNNLDLLCGDPALVNADLLLADMPNREELLASALAPYKSEYDFILCDCPPSFSLLSINALFSADYCLVPMVPEYLALEGLADLVYSLEQIKFGLERDVPILGILFTMVQSSIKLGREYKAAVEVVSLVREQFGSLVFKRMIRRDVRVCEAPAYGKTIFEYDPAARGAKEYQILANEVLDRIAILKKKEAVV